MIKKISSLILFISFISSLSIEAQSVWTKSSLSSFRDASDEEKITMPEHYVAYNLDIQGFKAQLQDIPTEEEWKNGAEGRIISLPMPDGSMERFEMYDSPVMAPKLAAKYPSIKSYKGSSLKTPGMTVRFDMGPYGFHAAIHGASDVFYIDPYAKGNTDQYLTYNVKDQLSQLDFDYPLCGTHDDHSVSTKNSTQSNTRNGGPIALNVYRFALSCTGEWGAIRGSVENVLADMNTSVNRINQLFEKELAIRLVLIEDNDKLVNLDGQTDPYISVSSGLDMLNVNTNITNTRVGSDAYDVGHVYHRSCDVGGIAALSSMCRSATKASAVTCHYNSNLEFMSSQVTTHELGHQMSAQHTFNNCSGNEALENAYEPGSGSTLMSYAGSCNINNVVNNGDEYYHVASLIQIYDHTRGTGLAGDGCAEVIETSNLEPSVTILHDNDFYIPEETYFFLEGIGEDENEEDELTYCWEQFNVGNPLDGSSLLGSPLGNSPHFRSMPPRTSPVRYFPSPDNILNGNFDRTEVLFEGNRTVNFMLTVRDNNAEAGTAVWQEVQFNIVDTPVKFGVTSQSNGESYEAGDEIDVTWNVAGTNFAPVGQSFMDILLYTGSDSEFSLENTEVLANRVFNNGSCKVILPNIPTNRGRIIVRASDGNFFSINSANFSISPAAAPKLLVRAEPLAQIQCGPSDGFTYNINTENIQGIEGEVTFTVLSGLPDGATVSFEPESAMIGDQSTLTILPINDPISSEHEVRIAAITESQDTFTRLIYMNLKSMDHSELNAIEPSQNAAGVSISTTSSFSWTPSPNADFYNFEISKSPAFGDTNLDAAYDLTELSYQPDIFLEKNTVYYWRVTSRNFCGEDPNVKTFAFATESLFCTQLSPAEGVLPINISSSGAPIIQAPIQVDLSGNVAEVNVKKFFGKHENNKDMVVSLFSPEGKEVILVSKKCEQSNFNCAFDDDSNVPVKCPLSNGSVYKPVQSLSNFNGDPLQGEWIFQIDDTQPGNGGKLEELIVEFCSNQILDNPFIVKNEKLTLELETTVSILSNRLKVEDNNNTNAELTYTIVNLPHTGELTLDGSLVAIGDQFSQEDIDDNKLSYTSANESGSTYFSFTVIDGEGGFIGITNFELEITEFTSTSDQQLNDEVVIYPIPAQNSITVDFTGASQEYSTFEIMNLHGQILTRSILTKGDVITLDISELTTGLYIINFRSNESLISKKIVVN